MNAYRIVKKILNKLLLTGEHTCPWWFAYTFDNPIRKLIHNPQQVLWGLVEKGQTVLDLGCGMGCFSIAMAKMVGVSGRVISADLQQQMLDILLKRAKKAGVQSRIFTHKCEPDRIGINEPFDFALLFWMAHEIPDKVAFLKEVALILKPQAKLLIVEPKIHVSHSGFEEIVKAGHEAGLKVEFKPTIRFSRAVVFSKPS